MDLPDCTNSKTKSYSDVLSNFNDIQRFALNRNDDVLYQKTQEMILLLEKDIVCTKKKTKQSRITDFFIK